MKLRKILMGMVVAVVSLGFTVSAFADTLEGSVAYANSRQLDLTIYDASGRPYPNLLRLNVDGQTKVYGATSVATLRKRDVVRAEIQQSKDGLWWANSVSRLQMAANSVPAAAKPSFNLMESLQSPTGQKLIKSGLTGAVVGGVASSASGGKAGKGALIGAGVGMLGGFLGDLLGQPQQAQPMTQTQYVPPAVRYRDDRSY